LFSDCEETDVLPCVFDGILTLHIQQKVSTELKLLRCWMYRFCCT